MQQKEPLREYRIPNSFVAIIFDESLEFAEWHGQFPGLFRLPVLKDFETLANELFISTEPDYDELNRVYDVLRESRGKLRNMYKLAMIEYRDALMPERSRSKHDRHLYRWKKYV